MRINLLAAMTRIANKQKNNKQINKQKKKRTTTLNASSIEHQTGKVYHKLYICMYNCKLYYWSRNKHVHGGTKYIAVLTRFASRNFELGEFDVILKQS